MKIIDRKKLEILRRIFLEERFSSVSDYWEDQDTLELYHRFLGQRIYWKWQAVLETLAVSDMLRESTPQTLIDFGCGTGIATLAYLAQLSRARFPEKVLLHDKSHHAMRFAQKKISDAYPELTVVTESRWSQISGTLSSRSLILLSHIINELAPGHLDSLMNQIAEAGAVIWVEAGSSNLSRALSEVREQLRTTFSIRAPCTHNAGCPMLAPSRSKDWCHFFAPTPSSVFQDSEWSVFAKTLHIDLHRVPYSYLVLQKSPLPELPPQNARVIGKTRIYKGYLKAQLCGASGLTERQVSKSKSPELYQLLEKENRHEIVEIGQ